METGEKLKAALEWLEGLSDEEIVTVMVSLIEMGYDI